MANGDQPGTQFTISRARVIQKNKLFEGVLRQRAPKYDDMAGLTDGFGPVPSRPVPGLARKLA
jgi:hypothetical protein